MYYLKDWQMRWQLPNQAMTELAQLMGMGDYQERVGAEGEKEAVVQQKVRFEAAQQGIRMWRNNVGVLKDDRGIPIRYGLANESKKMNTFPLGNQ